MNKIVFTGGGTAGHVTPNIALIESFPKEHWQMTYIGSPDGVEKSMIESIGVPYHAVKSGKLRRYFSLKNFIDPLNVFIGIAQSYFLLRKIKPNVVFSKGGFVALPVVIGAFLNRIPVIAHESDISPGLANRLSFPFVDKICVTFDAAKSHFKRADKVVVTGTPIRKQLFDGDKQRGLALSGLRQDKPCILIVGGSQGSTVLNLAVRNALSQLTAHFQVIHLCGKGKLDVSLNQQIDYFQLEYANQELPDLLAASDVVISRSGANALYEILALAKPHVLIPLPLTVSRGDQIQNAAYFQNQGISTVLEDNSLSPEKLLTAVNGVFANRDVLTKRMRALNIQSATDRITALIKKIIIARAE